MKKIFRWFNQFLFKSSSTKEGKAPAVSIPEHKTFTDTGEFIKAAEFKALWIEDNVRGRYAATDVLTDDEYLDYRMWEDLNHDTLYKEQLPNVRVFRGRNPNIIFHGGCLGCMSQRLHGMERCKGCFYFRRNGDKTNLKIEGEEAATMSAEELNKILKSRYDKGE